jgi:hypothetical protein
LAGIGRWLLVVDDDEEARVRLQAEEEEQRLGSGELVM